MPIITVLIVLAAIGAITYAVVRYVPMSPGFQRLITIVVIVACVLWVLSVAGLLPNLGAVRI